MFRQRSSPSAAIAAILVTLGPLSSGAAGQDPAGHVYGPSAPLGDGSIRTFAEVNRGGVPVSVGVIVPAAVVSSLPSDRSDGHRCFDVDADGLLEAETECLPTHERVLPFPSQLSARDDVPFKWMLFNWNPVGHAPPDIFDVPHFDIHFYLDAIENTFALMPGPCGPELLQCDQFDRARKPVPSGYVPVDFQNVDAAAPAMGNHLIDLTGHEFHGGTFDRAWIYGAYDGRITFWEEMVTLDFINGKPDRCFDIKVPSAYEVAGYYPTRSCYRHDSDGAEHRISLEGFVYRDSTQRLGFQR